MNQEVREKPIPEAKKVVVENIVEKIKSSRTILLASTKGLPTSQFQKIKKKLRGKADVFIAKKSLIVRAMGDVEKGTLQNFKKEVGADMALIFSNIEAFELSGMLTDSQTPAKAKAGDIAPEDINVEAGPTDLIPGPAISELGSVGLKVAVENGKLSIKQGATIAKAGEKINSKVASVLGKLNILPMKVGFIPLVAYDSENDAVYHDIKIDKEAALEELREAIGKALGFAVGRGYTVKETISYFISKAAMEEKALEAKVGSGAPTKEVKAEEPKTEEEKSAEEPNTQEMEGGAN